jgi:phosphoglycolate phosphatase-like HAD superfamily hydrolase
MPDWGGRSVGFDLDMTLLDTSTATAVALGAVNRRLGTRIDVDACVRAMGAPPREQLARWVPADRLDAALRALANAFLTEGLPAVRVLTGALTLLRGLSRGGGRAVVVTTRRTRIAVACLRRCGLPVAEVAGGLSAEGKANALREHRVDCYVGDHPLDMLAAVRAGVPGIGVTTGFHDAAQLSAAGAVAVVAGLAELAQPRSALGCCV